MGMNMDRTIKILQDSRIAFAKDELKKNRKRNTEWKHVVSYPCSNQVIATRLIKPRGYQSKWSNGNIDTYIPKKKGNTYYFEALETEEKDIIQEKSHEIRWMPWYKNIFRFF